MMTGSARARLLISPIERWNRRADTRVVMSYYTDNTFKINYEKSFMGSSKRGGHLPSVCFRAGNAAALLE
jgi:hypothetical protein